MWLFEVGICLILITNVFAEINPEFPIVNITSGQVVGSVAHDGDYYEYLGIPYADSTSGSHRFKAPLPPPTFTEPFIANRRDIKCIRALGVGYEGTEDCLVVNVYTPTQNVTKNLPVMVWIKGQEFDKASYKELSFKRLVEKDVIIVSLNYRESILGFLCLGTETAPGNAGLKDIIAGLKWVHENIAAFGGNPNDVTLFGHGSGASAVDLVTLSPMADGLIHKAIAQSGNAFSPWAVSRDNLKHAVHIAEALGHTITNIENLSDIFTKVSVSALMTAINDLDLIDNSLAFSPCLENNNLESIQPFMIKSPYEIISEGKFTPIPFLIGFVDNEGTITIDKVLESNWLQKIEDSFSDFLQADLKFESQEEKIIVANEINKFYFEDESINIHEYINYGGDSMILISAIREARLRSDKRISPVYLYQFSYKGKLGEPFIGEPFAVESSSHGEDLAYLFTYVPVISKDIDIPEKDLTVSDILIERWTNFAKHGVPLSEISNVPWHNFSVEKPHYIRILDGNEITEAAGTLEVDLMDPHSEKVNFWNNIYEEHFLDANSEWQSEDENNGDNGNNGDNISTRNNDGSEEDDGDDNGNGDNGGGDRSEEDDNGNGDNGGGGGSEEDDGDDNGNGEDDGDDNGNEDNGGGDGSEEDDGDDNGNGDNGGGDGSEEDDGDDNGNGDNGGGDGNEEDDGDDNGNGDNGGGDGSEEDDGGDNGNGDNGGGDGSEEDDGNDNGNEDNGGGDGSEEDDGDDSGNGDNGGGDGNNDRSDEDDGSEEDNGDDNGNGDNGGGDGNKSDEDDGSEEGDGDDNGNGDNGGGDGSEEVDGEEDDDNDDDDDGDPDSASTTVGYTFIIISLFTILQKIHSITLLT